MTTSISINDNAINQLDLAPVQTPIEKWLQSNVIADYAQQVQLAIDLSRDPSDPRELSEIPEVRLWFIRLDARYPWIPYLLDWENGELVRYAAMLVPHQFSRTEGIQFNPEALEIFVMKKVFVLADWMASRSLTSRTKLKFMAQVLGYDLDDQFFEFAGI